MKTLKYQLLIVSGIVLCILVILVGSLIINAFEEKRLARDYQNKNKIAEQLNAAAKWQAIERGLGVTILANGEGELSPLFQKFIEMGKKGDTQVVLAQKIAVNHPQKNDFSTKLEQWREKYDHFKLARQQIINSEISKDEWIKSATLNINHELTLHNLLFLPQNKTEHIVYLNSVLRPNITRLSEFAGLERALVANTLVGGEPFSSETINKLNHYHMIVEHYIEQILLLKELPFISNKMAQALVIFEKEFMLSFKVLRANIFAASKNGVEYPVDAETWFEAVTQTINTGLIISDLAGEQTNILILEMEHVAKIDLIISFFILLVILLMFYFISLWSKTHILIPCIKLAEDLEISSHQFFEAKKLLELLIVAEQKVSEHSQKLEQEIIERKHAEQEAKMASIAKSRFLATMSHELRTPLNGILGFAQNLQRNPTTTSQQQHALEVIEQSGQHLLSLINDILDLAKVESGKIDLYKTDFHLSPLIKGVGEIIQISAQQKNISFHLEHSDNLPTEVHGDEKRLRQILLNLLGNAIKFTELGKVILRITMDGEKITFSVEDSGVGLSSEELNTIFEPFQQGGDKKHQIKGTGLGLTISTNLINLMGGQLQVKSKIGVGTIFWFDLILPVVLSEKMEHVIISQHEEKQMVFPPLEEVNVLYNLSIMGDIKELKEQITVLTQPQLKPFVEKMQFFIKHYQLNKITELLENKRTRTNEQ